MKALTYALPGTKSGAPSVQLVEQPMPITKWGEVLVRIHYAGLNHFEIATSKGERNQAIARALKKGVVVSGIEMAGIAESDGKNIRQGDRVVGYTHIFKGPFFHAEYVAVPETNLTVIPENVSLEGATSIVGGALTSINALERIARLSCGNNVLITGATGSVGITGVQLATHLGARVTAVCHSTQTEFVISQGAAHAYAYDKSELPNAESQFDLVYDTAPSLSFASAKKYLTTVGRYVTTMPQLDIVGFLMSQLSARKWGYLMEYDTDMARMERLRVLISEGAFSPAVDSVYKPETAADAFSHQLQPGKKGKILIDFRSER